MNDRRSKQNAILLENSGNFQTLFPGLGGSKVSQNISFSENHSSLVAGTDYLDEAIKCNATGYVKTLGKNCFLPTTNCVALQVSGKME